MLYKNKKISSLSLFTCKEFNPLVRFLTLSDLLMNSGFGLIAPVFAIYITDNISGATIETVGIATTIFLVTKSLTQIPVGIIIDKKKGEKDDMIALLIGLFVYSAIPLFYILIHSVWQLFLIQFIYGLSASFAYPSWMAIFTRHVDKKHEGLEWSIYATLIEFGMAVSATVGGFVAYKFGFDYLFILASILIFIGNLFIIDIYRKLQKN